MKLNSIFVSVNGEVNKQGIGSWATFVRVQGCSAKCLYCDTLYAQSPKEGQDVPLSTIVDDIVSLGCYNVTLTGGEPMEQYPEIQRLVMMLRNRDLRFKINLETNGKHIVPLDVMWALNCVVMDIKTTNSGQVWDCFVQPYIELRECDFVKAVIGKRKDFEESLREFSVIRESGCKAKFAMSPMEGLPPRKLFEWMHHSNLWDFHFNVQLHKFLRVP